MDSTVILPVSMGSWNVSVGVVPRYIHIPPHTIDLRGSAVGQSFQIRYPVIGDLDLLLQHRNAPGEVVMLPDFPGQLVQFGVGDSLLRVQLGLHITGGLVAGDDYPSSDRPPVMRATTIVSIQ